MSRMIAVKNDGYPEGVDSSAWQAIRLVDRIGKGEDFWRLVYIPFLWDKLTASIVRMFFIELMSTSNGNFERVVTKALRLKNQDEYKTVRVLAVECGYQIFE